MPASLRFIHLLIPVLAVWVLGDIHAVYGQDAAAQEAFDSLYADQLKKAKATRSVVDDLALAATLVDAAGAADDVKLVTIILDHAYQLSNRSIKGFETAEKALKLQIEKVPANEARLRKELVDLHQRRYLRTRGKDRYLSGHALLDEYLAYGDRVQTTGQSAEAIAIYEQALMLANKLKSPTSKTFTKRIERINQVLQSQKRLEELQIYLIDNPTDKKAIHEFLILLLVEKDDAATALEFKSLFDQTTQKVLALITTDAEKHSLSDTLALAQWHHDLALLTSGSGRVKMLAKARQYYTALVAKTEDQAVADDVKITLGEIDRDSFNALYADQIKEVSKTPRAEDDAVLAGDLLKTASQTSDRPAFKALLLESSFELGAKSSGGFESADKAMQLMIEASPAQAVELRPKLLGLYQRQHERTRGKDRKVLSEQLVQLLVQMGDDQMQAGEPKEALILYRRGVTMAKSFSRATAKALTGKLAEASRIIRVDTQLAQARIKARKQPNNLEAADELLRLLIVEKDDPAAASKDAYLFDEKTEAKIGLAAQPIEELKADDLMTLGKWYYKLASNAHGPAKVSMLSRAKRYYTGLVGVSEDKSLVMSQANVQIKQIDLQLDRLKPKDPVKIAAQKTVQPRLRNLVTYVSDDSMPPFERGTRFGAFPVQRSTEARAPFAGIAVYFNQASGQNVVYQIERVKPIKKVYCKFANSTAMTISIIDPEGKVLSTSTALDDGNVYSELLLDVPAKVSQNFKIQIHNEDGTWFLIARIEMR